MDLLKVGRKPNDEITKETSNVVRTVEEGIQNAISTSLDNIIIPKNKISLRIMNASSRQDVAGVTKNSETGEQARNSAHNGNVKSLEKRGFLSSALKCAFIGASTSPKISRKEH